MTRSLSLALAAVLCAGAASAAGLSPTATAQKFMQLGTSADPADQKAALAMCAKASAMVDEFAPFVWTGAGACERWYADFGGWMKSADIQNEKVTLGSPTMVKIEGETAYVVFAASETFTHAGAAMSETGRLAFTFRKMGGVWTITSGAWAGARPHPAPLAAQK